MDTESEAETEQGQGDTMRLQHHLTAIFDQVKMDLPSISFENNDDVSLSVYNKYLIVFIHSPRNKYILIQAKGTRSQGDQQEVLLQI